MKLSRETKATLLLKVKLMKLSGVFVCINVRNGRSSPPDGASLGVVSWPGGGTPTAAASCWPLNPTEAEATCKMLN